MTCTLVWWSGPTVVLKEIDCFPTYTKFGALPTISLSQSSPFGCSYQQRENPYTCDIHIISAQAVQKDQATELRDQYERCLCSTIWVQAWRGMATSSPFLPGATMPDIPYYSPMCLFRTDNHILYQKHTALFHSCLTASAEHWGSCLNECVWTSHKFWEEKVMQIFHLHSSRLWPQGNHCVCVVSAKGFQVHSDLACKINSHVKGLGFVQKYCWKETQWFLWLSSNTACLDSEKISIQHQLQPRFLLQQSYIHLHLAWWWWQLD